jgi:hypothetical protein
MHPNVSKELSNVMDCLAALKIDLSCEAHIPGETLVLSAAKSRDACEALSSAFDSIKQVAVALNGKDSGEPPSDRRLDR